jgi:hypothetical protein
MRMGLTWGLVWAVVGAVVGLVVRLTSPGSDGRGLNEVVIGALYGIVGVLWGTAFGMTVSIVGRRRASLHLSPLRAAMWGLLASAGLPLLLSMHEILALVLSLMGGLSALATLVIRRAEARHAVPWQRP